MADQAKEQELVKINIRASIRVKWNGEMTIPKEMWDRVPDDEMWSDEIEDYVQPNIDFSSHHDIHFDDSDINLDDVTLSK